MMYHREVQSIASRYLRLAKRMRLVCVVWNNIRTDLLNNCSITTQRVSCQALARKLRLRVNI